MSSFSGYALILSTVMVAVSAVSPNPHHRQLQAQPKHPELVRYTDRRDAAGQFASQSVDSSGTHITEQGRLVRRADGKDYVLVKQGSYGYSSPEGVPIQISWTADENGFHPEGDSLPLGPSELSRR